MTSNHPINSIESLESFCTSVSQAISNEGFDVRIQPGDHLVDDAGADSLTVLKYVSHLQGLGLTIELSSFDTSLLNIDIAYHAWLQKVAIQCQGEL